MPLAFAWLSAEVNKRSNMLNLHSLRQEEGLLLFQNGSGALSVSVREHLNLRWLYFHDEAVQALMDCSDPSMPMLPYARAMCCALVYQNTPCRILSLGLGGGTLERFFSHKFPEVEIHSVESDTRIIDIARQYFQLPEDVVVFEADAEQFLAQAGESYDMVFCDLFDSNGLSRHLKTKEFYQHINQGLADNGVLSINVLVQSQQEMLDLLLVLRSVFPHVVAIDLPDYRNVILFAFRSEPISKNEALNRVGAMDELLGYHSLSLIQALNYLPPRSQQS